jgi:FKBP-type peptidyl-prolyl cis-trans isomerase 2
MIEGKYEVRKENGKMNDSHKRINEDVQAVLGKSDERENALDGTVKEGLQRRFTVLNERDYKKYVPREVKARFESDFKHVSRSIESGRMKEGKEPFNNYVVINLDESYIDEVIEILKRNGHWG